MNTASDTQKHHPHNQKGQLTKAERTLARRIADELNEREPGQHALIRRIVGHLGVGLSLVFLQKAHEAEEQGGMVLQDGTTRRTPGGVFFRIVKDQAKDYGHPDIGTLFWNHPKRVGPPPPPTPPKERPKPLFWMERLDILSQLAEQGKSGMITTAVLKVIGKVTEHYDHPSGCTVLRLVSTITPAVPRGVPAPQETPTIYAIYLGNRLWGRIAQAATDSEDEIIVEGFPQLDSESGTIALYARKTTSKKLEAARFQKVRKPEQETLPQQAEEHL